MTYLPVPAYNASQNLLQMVGQACAEIGIRKPTSLFSSTDNQAIQLLALAQREAKEFYSMAHRSGGWQELRKQFIINLVPTVSGYTGTLTEESNTITNLLPSPGALVIVPPPLVSALNSGIPYDTRFVNFGSGGSDLTRIVMDCEATISGNTAISFNYDSYAMPSDFGYFIPQTSWDRSFRWQLLGPLEAQEWQVLKSGISPTGPRRRFRIMGNQIFIDPPPAESEELVIEYYSNSWCVTSPAASLTATQNYSWQTDGDYYLLDPDAFIMGIKWRFKAAKGLDYQQEKSDYSARCERLMARNGGNRDLPLNAQASGMRLLNQNNVPDTGFGS